MLLDLPPSAHQAEQPILMPASIEDFEFIATLFSALHNYNASLNEQFSLAPQWREVLYRHFLETWNSTNALWLLVWIQGQPVGILILETHCASALFQHHKQVELVALYIERSLRRLGLARRLMEYAQNWVISQGLHRMQLYVTIQNEHARTFYQRCGWYPVLECSVVTISK